MRHVEVSLDLGLHSRAAVGPMQAAADRLASSESQRDALYRFGREQVQGVPLPFEEALGCRQQLRFARIQATQQELTLGIALNFPFGVGTERAQEAI